MPAGTPQIDSHPPRHCTEKFSVCLSLSLSLSLRSIIPHPPVSVSDAKTDAVPSRFAAGVGGGGGGGGGGGCFSRQRSVGPLSINESAGTHTRTHSRTLKLGATDADAAREERVDVDETETTNKQTNDVDCSRRRVDGSTENVERRRASFYKRGRFLFFLWFFFIFFLFFLYFFFRFLSISTVRRTFGGFVSSSVVLFSLRRVRWRRWRRRRRTGVHRPVSLCSSTPHQTR